MWCAPSQRHHRVKVRNGKIRRTMITIPQDMALRRLQARGLLLNFMTDEQKLAVYNKYNTDIKTGVVEKNISDNIKKLQADLVELKKIATLEVITPAKVM